MLYWPDTTLYLEAQLKDWMLYIGYAKDWPVGVQEVNPEKEQFQLSQNYPNPANDQSLISMYIPGKGTVNVTVTDMQGRVFLSTDCLLDKGSHTFRFTPGGGNQFLLTARWNGLNRNIKILTTEPNPGKMCRLDYTGSGNGETPLKTATLKKSLVEQESGILDTAVTNKTYIFQFATNIPCPGTPTVTYEGQVYNTIQIFSQCWLKENLNVGTMIPGTQDQTNNNIIEKYCYNNEPDSCSKYGGLYQWDEMMQYTTRLGAQGICPSGWHLPMDEEWKVLDGAVDSQYGIGDPIWDTSEYVGIGYDVGLNLKTTHGWYTNSNGTDLFGFSGLSGGNRTPEGNFVFVGCYAWWWTSSDYLTDSPWQNYLYYDYTTIGRCYSCEGKVPGCSARCIKNY
jgi:uncharacterized protein (TIGR02145 family)